MHAGGLSHAPRFAGLGLANLAMGWLVEVRSERLEWRCRLLGFSPRMGTRPRSNRIAGLRLPSGRENRPPSRLAVARRHLLAAWQIVLSQQAQQAA
jgi:hypothetical protein